MRVDILSQIEIGLYKYLVILKIVVRSPHKPLIVNFLSFLSHNNVHLWLYLVTNQTKILDLIIEYIIIIVTHANGMWFINLNVHPWLVMNLYLTFNLVLI
jgi:hypothetical protein